MAKAKTPRITAAEKSQRVDRCYKMLLTGATHADLVRYGSEKWGIGERAVEKYITEAKTAIQAASEVTREAMRAEMTAAMKLSASKSAAISDQQGYIKAWQEIAKLWGLYAPTQYTHLLGMLGVSEEMVKALGLAAQTAGHDVGELFEALIAEIAEEAKKANG